MSLSLSYFFDFRCLVVTVILHPSLRINASNFGRVEVAFFFSSSFSSLSQYCAGSPRFSISQQSALCARSNQQHRRTTMLTALKARHLPILATQQQLLHVLVTALPTLQLTPPIFSHSTRPLSSPSNSGTRWPPLPLRCPQNSRNWRGQTLMLVVVAIAEKRKKRDRGAHM